MIYTSRTPLRISLFGGGTDYPEYFERRPGATLGFAIDKYIYISALPLSAIVEYRYRISYSRVEMVDEISEVQHPVARAVLAEVGFLDPTDYSIQADLPANAGLGSSSAFTVGFQNVVWTMAGRSASKMELALQAIHVERELLQELVGAQDQLHAAFGGFNRFDFSKSAFQVTRFGLSAAALRQISKWMVLVYTGSKRHASSVLREQVSNTSHQKVDSELENMRAIVDEAEKSIRDARDPSEVAPGLAPLLAESWALKRTLSSKVSTDGIDDLYDACMSRGALAGKLCGAGGGSFLLMIVPPGDRGAFVDAVGPRGCVDFEIDTSGSTMLETSLVANGRGNEERVQ